MIASGKIALRLTLAAITFMVAVVVLVIFGGPAHADDVTPEPLTEPDQSAAPQDPPAPNPPAQDPPAQVPPADDPPPQDPPAEDPPAQDPPADLPTDEATTPPAPAGAPPVGNPPAGADGPDDSDEPDPEPEDPNALPNDNDQTAGATTNGTGVADTGNNDASSTVDTTTDGTGTPAPAGDASADADVTSGPGNAQGTTDTSAITQSVDAQATDEAAIDILQIALVVNVGVSHASTGDNGAAALTGGNGDGGAGTGNAAGTVATGDAGAIGNQSTTTVTQSAVVGSGEDSSQLATVFNIGIGVGNTGLNVAIGSVAWNGAAAAAQGISTTSTPAGAGSSSANVAAGGADALGNRSTSHIVQVAVARASGQAVLYIDQRAIIVNFGNAFANTGGNLAIGSFDAGGLTQEEIAVVQAVMSFLLPLLGDAQLGGSAAQGGSGTADILTGTAAAVGNDSTTAVAQTAIGNASGTETASASQRVTVANFGLALANTGFNLAIGNVGGLPASAEAELAQADADLAHFFSLLSDTSWLNSENPFAAFSQTIDLGGLVLSLGGDISGIEFLAGWDAAYAPNGPLAKGIRIRQITGVLNIGIAFSNTGRNTVISLVGNDTTREITDTMTFTAALDVASTNDALASVRTGTAFALGNDATVVICQEFHDELACAPTPPPEQPSDPGPTPPALPGDSQVVAPAAVFTDPLLAPATLPVAAPEPVDAPERAGMLPMTGNSDSTQGWAVTALSMIGLGAVLTRRRRSVR